MADLLSATAEEMNTRADDRLAAEEMNTTADDRLAFYPRSLWHPALANFSPTWRPSG
jgi:hypothetical protein